jgi:hypothetical protein
VATGTTLTGLFSWSINNGVQSSDTTNNSWIFFVDGNVMNGSIAANMSDGKISGILDPNGGSSGNIGQNIGANSTAGSTSAPNTTTYNFVDSTASANKTAMYIIPGNEAGGYFNGKINLKSPTAAFSGKGQLQGTPARQDILVIINTGKTPASTTPPINIPASTVPDSKFTFRGTRLFTGSATTQTQASN